jgi:hypothetical protein
MIELKTFGKVFPESGNKWEKKRRGWKNEGRKKITVVANFVA